MIYFFINIYVVQWWDSYGDEVPELQAFAIRVLGLTCSASACERNWSTFNQVHTKRRNRLSTSKMNDLVYIMYNRRLKYNFMKKLSLKDEDDPLIVEDVPSDDEWMVDPENEEDDDSLSVEANDAIEDEGQNSASLKRKNIHVDLEEDDESNDDYDGGAFKMDHVG